MRQAFPRFSWLTESGQQTRDEAIEINVLFHQTWPPATLLFFEEKAVVRLCRVADRRCELFHEENAHFRREAD